MLTLGGFTVSFSFAHTFTISLAVVAYKNSPEQRTSCGRCVCVCVQMCVCVCDVYNLVASQRLPRSGFKDEGWCDSRRDAWYDFPIFSQCAFSPSSIHTTTTTHKCLCWEHKSLYYKPFLLLHAPGTNPKGLVIGVQKPCRYHAETRIMESSDSVTGVPPPTRNCSKVAGWLVVLMRGRDFNHLHLNRF